MESKVCRLCGAEKSLDDFYEAAGARDGRRTECKACMSAVRKQWYRGNRDREIARVTTWNEANRERRKAYQEEYKRSGRRSYMDRKSHLKRKFGLSLEDYDRLLAEQNGVCSICEDPPPADVAFHVDHDHETGAVRGLLCVRCNQGLGQFREDMELLAQAMRYLERAELTYLHQFAARRVEALKSRVRSHA